MARVPAWLRRLTELGDITQGTVESPEAEPWLPIRAVIPTIQREETDPFGPALAWAGETTRLGEPVDDCLWEFVELEHASDLDILAFARRFGLLSAVTLADPPFTNESLAGWRLQPGTEPLSAWRAVAAGVRALLDIATSIHEGSANDGRPDAERWNSALGAVATLVWLVETNRAEPPPTSRELFGAWLGMVGLDGSGQYTAPVDRLRWLVGELLRLAGVRPVPATVGMTKPVARYRLMATGFGRLEQPPPTAARPAGRLPTSLSQVYWRVANLLPVLAVELARAIEPGEHYRCTRCGRLARVAGRRPGRRSEWFGDHNYCRRLHRAGIVRRAAARRNSNLKAAQGGDRDEQD